MIPNATPRTTDEEKRILSDFVRSNTEAAIVLKRVIAMYMEHFRDIRSIDVTQNVGLQTCSHLRAYDMIEEIFGELELCERFSEEKKAKKTFR